MLINGICGRFNVFASISSASAATLAFIAGFTAYISCNNMVSKVYLCFAMAAYSFSTTKSR